MTPTEDTIVVFTARSPERILREGGSQAWKLDPRRARNCQWLVCTQNRHNPDHEFSDATEPHGAAFLLGKIKEVRKSRDPGDEDRWMIAISDFARIDVPDAWDHGRNPVRYTSLQALNIDAGRYQLKPMPLTKSPTQPDDEKASTSAKRIEPMSIQEAKQALAKNFGVPPDAIEITIRL